MRRFDSIVRGLAVFGGALCGVVMVVRPEIMLPMVVVVAVLASVAADYFPERSS